MALSLFSRFSGQARKATPQSYVQSVQIDGLRDPFDADDLWMAPRMAYTGETLRLRHALESRPERRQGRKTQQVFSQVQILLPSATIVRDRRAARGASGSAMVARLADLHREDFGEKAGPGPVRYQVLGSDEVPEGSALVRFGLGIYVPACENRANASAPSAQPDAEPSEGSSEMRCRLQVSVDGGVIFAPLANVHPDERLIVIGADTTRASYAIPFWPYPTDLLLVVVNEPGQPLEVGAEPYGSMQIRAGDLPGDHVVTMPNVDSLIPSLVLRVIDDRPNAGPLRKPVTHKYPGVAGEVKATPQVAEASELVQPSCADPVDLQDSSPSVGDRDKTYVASRTPGVLVKDPLSAQTYVPQRRQPLPRLSLAGLVLQRVSLYAQVGVTGFRVGFDTVLQLTASDRAAWLRLDVDALDRLTVTTRSGQQALKLPATFAHREDKLEIRPPSAGMQAHCVGLVLRNFGVSEPIPAGMPLTTGRGQRLLSSLRVLDGLGGVIKADDQSTSSDDQMGLSRRAFNMQVGDRTLQISQLAPTQRLFHMDEDLNLLAEMDGTANDTAVLQPGQYLAASHYLWRFDAPELQ